MSEVPGPAAARLQSLDALRGIAATWVVLYNTVFIPTPALVTPEWAWPARLGGMGVTLFFVVNAFSLCYTMPSHAGDQNPSVAFYVRRFFRIAPLFYVMLIFTFWRDLHVFGLVHGFGEVLANATFLFNLIPGWQPGFVWSSWTVGVGMVFYLLFPLFYKYAAGQLWGALSLAGACLMAASVAMYTLRLFPIDVNQYYEWTFFRHLPVFAMGIVAYYAVEHLPNDRRRAPIGLTLFFASAIAFTALLQNRTGLLEPYHWQGLVFATLLCGLVANPIPILVNRVTAFLGKLSYSIYLLHPALIAFIMPFYRVVYAYPIPLSVKYALCCALTLCPLVAISYCTFRWIETPGIQLGKRILSNRRRRPAVEESALPSWISAPPPKHKPPTDAP